VSPGAIFRRASTAEYCALIRYNAAIGVNHVDLVLVSLADHTSSFRKLVITPEAWAIQMRSGALNFANHGNFLFLRLNKDLISVLAHNIHRRTHIAAEQSL
jgi:hypothetical protein